MKPDSAVARRELLDCKLLRRYGLDWLKISVRRVGRKRAEAGVYLVQAAVDKQGRPLRGVLNVIKPCGELYEVTAHACTCPAGRHTPKVSCRHREGLAKVGLLPAAPEPGGDGIPF